MQYIPSPFSVCASFQTLSYIALAAMQLFVHGVRYNRQLMILSDGGEVGLDWVIQKTKKQNRNIVVCIPGLSGDEKEQYCISTA
jgi:predicted alpha/beta-fold hydrolase